jgi:GNAT superfamily N-acetyltransferase
MIKIKKLTEKYLAEASMLANSIFKDEPILPGVAFEASLDKKKFDKLNEGSVDKIYSLEYFVAIDESGRVLGTTGLYAMEKDKGNTYWLGWYCVGSKYRGRGVGGKLLDYTIKEAKKRGKRILRLYTSPSDDEKTAQIIYDSRGFKTTGTERKEGSKYEIIYKELSL